MNDDFEDLRKLIALKRYEQPPEGFVEDFLREFHVRQREAAQKRGLLDVIKTRVEEFFSHLSAPQWGLVGAAAAVLIWGVMAAQPDHASPGGDSMEKVTPVSHSENKFEAQPIVIGLEDDHPDADKEAQAKNKKPANPTQPPAAEGEVTK